MFDQLSERLQKTLKRVRGQARLTEDNIKDTLREVRMALLEADVALPVVKAFVERVRERAVGQEVLKSLSPGQAFVKIVQRRTRRRSWARPTTALNLKAQPPAVVLMAGLQGAGKTTTVAKLARCLTRAREEEGDGGQSADVYRPAAIEQLETLAGEVEVRLLPQRSPTRSRWPSPQAALEHAQDAVPRCADRRYRRPPARRRAT